MVEGINFFKQQIARLRKKTRRLFLIRTISLTLMIIYGLVVVSAFSHFLLVKKKNELLKEEVAEREKVVENLRPIETKHVFLASKTKSLARVFPAKKRHQEIVDLFFSLLPEEVLIANFHIEEGGRVNFSGSCLNFKVLENFLLRFQEESSELKIKQIQVEKLSYGFEEEYAFYASILFYLGGE